MPPAFLAQPGLADLRKLREGCPEGGRVVSGEDELRACAEEDEGTLRGPEGLLGDLRVRPVVASEVASQPAEDLG